MLLGKYLKKYYKKYALSLILGVLILAAVDYFQLYIPDLLGNIVALFSENYVASEIIDDVSFISLEVLLICFGLFIGRVTFRLFLFSASTGITQGLRQEMFEKAERLDQAYYHSTKTGNIMSWITSDTEEVQEYFGWGTVMLVDGVFMTTICIIKMIMLDWAMSLLIMIPIILIIIWGLLVEKVMSDVWLNHQKELDKLYDFSEENFSGIRVIKAFLKETQQLKEFAKIARKNKDADIKLGVFSVAFDIIIELLIDGILALILGVGGFFVYQTVIGEPTILFTKEVTLTPDKLVKFMAYFMTSIWPLIALGSVITMHSRAKTSYKRIEDFLDVEEVLKDSQDAKVLENVKGKIEFKNLTFGYPNTKDIKLNNVSLVINPGENIGVVGRVGSGKTTIVYLLSKMYNVKKNSILIDDQDIMKVTTESVRKNVSVVPQDNFLFSTSVEENIKFGNESADFTNVKEAAIFSDVDKDIEGFSDKYNSLTGERGVSLSGGQKQRIAIARAFIKDAPIMVFDDSVSAVDINTEEKILNNIKELRKGKTTIIIASRVSTVNKLDKIIVLNEGNLEAFDTPKNLLKISPTYKKMVYLQKLEDELKEAN